MQVLGFCVRGSGIRGFRVEGLGFRDQRIAVATDRTWGGLELGIAPVLTLSRNLSALSPQTVAGPTRQIRLQGGTASQNSYQEY